MTKKQATIDDLIKDQNLHWHREHKGDVDNKIADLESKKRELRRGSLGIVFKSLGAATQATLALTDQGTQKALQPVVAIVQISAGLAGLFKSARDMSRINDGLSNARRTKTELEGQADQAKKPETDNSNASPGSEESKADAERTGPSSKNPGLHAA